VGRYTRNLARALPPVLDASEHLLVLRDPRGAGPLLNQAGNARCVDVALSPFTLRQQWVVPRVLRRHKIGVYHSPYYLMPFRPGAPAVVTIHDLIPFKYPRYFSVAQRWTYAVAIRLACRAARVIVAVSQTTARDVVQLAGISAARIAVIPEAADPVFQPRPEATVAEVRARLRLPAPYALCVGANKPHKNLVRLMEAWRQMGADAIPLILAGPWDDRFPEARRAADACGDRVRFMGVVADADLAALYSSALLVVCPSEDEGFGLPLIEAMACGAPVACSNVASLAEVAADAVLFFDPHDVRSIANAVTALQRDTALRAELAQRGRGRATQYTWEDTARRTLEVYRTATGDGAQRI
jgi:alpha-1,3-rhamnosyl/mannosyltransferase